MNSSILCQGLLLRRQDGRVNWKAKKCLSRLVRRFNHVSCKDTTFNISFFFYYRKNDPETIRRREEKKQRLNKGIQNVLNQIYKRKPSWNKSDILRMDMKCLRNGERCIMWDDAGAGFYMVRLYQRYNVITHRRY